VWALIARSQAVPPTVGESIFLVLLTALFNILGGNAFGRIGRADPKHARSAVRRLVSIGLALGAAQTEIEAAL